MIGAAVVAATRPVPAAVRKFISQMESRPPWDYMNDFIEWYQFCATYADLAGYEHVHVFAGHTRQASLLHFWNPALSLTVEGTVTHTEDGDLQPDGTTGKLKYTPGKTLADLGVTSLDENTLLVYVNSDFGGLIAECGALGGGGTFQIRSRSGAVQGSWSMTTVQVTNNVSTSLGLTGFVRTNNNKVAPVKSALGAEITSPSVAVPSGEFKWGWAGSGSSGSPNALSFGFMSSTAKPADKIDALNFACTRFLDKRGTREIFIPEPPLGVNCFTREIASHALPAGIQIYRQGGVPATDFDDATDPDDIGPAGVTGILPATRIAGQITSTVLASTQTLIGLDHLIWCIRSTGPVDGVLRTGITYTPNQVFGAIKNSNGDPCGPQSTSDDAADGSTLAMVGRTLGLAPFNDLRHIDGKGWCQLAEDRGYDVSMWYAAFLADPTDPVFTGDVNQYMGAISPKAYFVANADTVFVNTSIGGSKYKVAFNVCILPPNRVCDCATHSPGVALDWEPNDKRGPARALALIQELRKICNATNGRLTLTGHKPNGGTGANDGFGDRDVCNEMLPHVDGFGLLCYTADVKANGAINVLQQQMDWFKGSSGTLPINPARLLVQYGIGYRDQMMTDADTILIRDWLQYNSVGGYWIAPQYSPQGGDMTHEWNKRLARLFRLESDFPAVFP